MAVAYWTSKQAWDHLVEEVLNAKDVLPYWAYNVGLNDIDDFMYLRQADFEVTFTLPSSDVEGTTEQPTSQNLTRVLVGKLLRAQRWFEKQPRRSYDTWAGLTKEGLNFFIEIEPGPSTPTTPISPTPFQSMTMEVETPVPKKSEREKTGIASYTKSIKRSTEDYPIFQDGKMWYNWQRKIRTKATAQGYRNVLSTTYIPEDDEAAFLWEEHQSFMFDVFADKIQTPTGKQIVRKHEATLDAQQVWADLCQEYAAGVQADIAAASVEKN